jgi:hypothetical protein
LPRQIEDGVIEGLIPQAYRTFTEARNLGVDPVAAPTAQVSFARVTPAVGVILTAMAMKWVASKSRANGA